MSKIDRIGLATAAIWLTTVGMPSAQDAPALAPAEALTPQAAAPPAPAGPEWHVFSRSSDRAYLIDLGTVAEANGANTVRVARVSRRNPAGDYSHSVESYTLRCSANQVKLGETVEYDPAGTEADRFDDGADWEEIPPDSVDEYVKMQVCDGQRSAPPSYPSIQAFIDSGRGG